MKKTSSMEQELKDKIEEEFEYVTFTITSKQIIKLNDLANFVLVEALNMEPRLSKSFELLKLIDNNKYETTYIRLVADTKAEAIELALSEIDKMKKKRKFRYPYKDIKKPMTHLSELEIEKKWSRNPKSNKYYGVAIKGYLDW